MKLKCVHAADLTCCREVALLEELVLALDYTLERVLSF
jgi:hypothetical protein